VTRRRRRRAAGGDGAALLVALAACCFGAISTLTVVATRRRRPGAPSLETLLFWRYVLAGVVLAAARLARRRAGRARAARGRGACARARGRRRRAGGGGVPQHLGAALDPGGDARLPVLHVPGVGHAVRRAARHRAVDGGEARRARAVARRDRAARWGCRRRAASAGRGPAWPGVALALAAAVVYALYIPYLGRLQARAGPPGAPRGCARGRPRSSAPARAARGTLTAALGPAAWGAVAVLALVCTVLAFLAFMRGLGRLGPVRTAIVSTVEPFFTAVLGAVVLGQPFGRRRSPAARSSPPRCSSSSGAAADPAAAPAAAAPDRA
jgi:drug/metabolite transporter (DMT)-like permease